MRRASVHDWPHRQHPCLSRCLIRLGDHGEHVAAPFWWFANGNRPDVVKRHAHLHTANVLRLTEMTWSRLHGMHLRCRCKFPSPDALFAATL
jgi:hypothetical protein